MTPHVQKGELFKLGWTHVTALRMDVSKEKRSEDLKHNTFYAVASYKPNSLKVQLSVSQHIPQRHK